ncbi:MAG: DUF2924 domain-containing protein [Myxococcales bacterium]
MKASARARVAAQQLGDLDRELAAIAKMNTPQLLAKFRELYGEPSRSRNKNHLIRRLSWRVQELREGGLAPRALELITQLGDQMPERWVRRVRGEVAAPTKRDARLPPAGTRLSRVYRGATYEVMVLEDGFEYQGKRYRSLSAVAKQITGTNWNGLTFFGAVPATEASE